MTAKAGATTVCPDWPLCDGSLFPALDDPAYAAAYGAPRAGSGSGGVGRLCLGARARRQRASPYGSGPRRGGGADCARRAGSAHLRRGGAVASSRRGRDAPGARRWALFVCLVAAAPRESSRESAVAKPESAYDALAARFRRVSLLGEAAGLLGWDSATSCRAAAARRAPTRSPNSNQVCHEALCDPRIGEWLDRAENESATLEGWRRVDLAAMRRRWRRANALDPSLKAATTRARLACEMAWRTARPADDFAGLAPAARRSDAAGSRDRRRRWARRFGCAPYDAMLDAYQPGLRAADFEPLFEELEAFLPGFRRRLDGAAGRASAAAAAAGTVSRRRAARPGARIDERRGLPFRAGPARRERAPVLRRRSGRPADHNAIRRGGFHAVADGGIA